MPRPKVKPENRQRSTRACVPCKASKTRCDAAEPCGPCGKRERTDSCVYPPDARKTGPRKRRRLSQPASAATQQNTSLSGTANIPEDSQYDVAAVDTANTTTTTTPEPEPSASSRTKSRMLLSSKGEKLFVGENASLSFLRFLRHIVKKYMGECPFSESQFKDSMLEVNVARDELPVNHIRDQAELSRLVQLYREASSGVLDLFSTSEVRDLLERYGGLRTNAEIAHDDDRRKGDQASLNMMLAIGCQCARRSDDAARYFSSAQVFAFSGFVLDPSLTMVRVFLLMAFYLLGQCHRNGAYMYLGVASQAACALGLHQKGHHKVLTPQECLARERTWKSLLILDTIVSSILGRSGSLAPVRSQDVTPYGNGIDTDQTDRSQHLASQAVGAVCMHIIELEQRISQGTNLDSAAAESFLSRLRQWNETSLPPELRDCNPLDRELFIGAAHVACTYYFTIILVTRPFLITHLLTQIRRKRRPSVEPADTARIPDLAQACVDAAVYTVAAVESALIASNNMRLMKAWVFVSGLILGLSMFALAHSEPVREVDEAFRTSITVLERLSMTSEQALLYCRILGTFSDAIRARRAQLESERRSKSDRLVSQIFTANTQNRGSLSAGDGAGSSSVNSYGVDHDYNIGSAMYDQTGTFQPVEDFPFLSENLYIDWGSVWPEMDLEF